MSNINEQNTPVSTAFSSFTAPTTEEINAASNSRVDALNNLTKTTVGNQFQRIQGIIDFLSSITGFLPSNLQNKMDNIIKDSLNNLESIGRDAANNLLNSATVYAMNIIETSLNKLF